MSDLITAARNINIMLQRNVYPGFAGHWIVAHNDLNDQLRALPPDARIVSAELLRDAAEEIHAVWLLNKRTWLLDLFTRLKAAADGRETQ